MKHNTRWNPTWNGPLHLGHIYSLLINEKFAHDSNGKFTVRFDDDSPPVLVLKDRAKEIGKRQQEDIEWLDVQVDRWQWQTKLLPEVHTRLEILHHKYMIDALERTHNLPLTVRMMGTNWLPYPYVPQQTAERVIMDNMIETTHVIRGEEFLTEFALYHYYCEQFRISPPDFVFIPRLMSGDGDISKHCGGYTIAEFRAKGYKAQDIKDMLAEACLYWPANGWSFHNMKPNPRIMI